MLLEVFKRIKQPFKLNISITRDYDNFCFSNILLSERVETYVNYESMKILKVCLPLRTVEIVFSKPHLVRS